MAYRRLPGTNSRRATTLLRDRSNALGPTFRPVGVRRAEAADGEALFAELEGWRGGRLGVAVLDLEKGGRRAYRGDERFAMCSTFKLLAAAFVLARVDRQEERLDRHGIRSVATRTAVRAECQRRGGLKGGGHRTMRAARGPAESARTMSEWSHWHDVVIEKRLAPGWRTVVRGVTGPFMPLARAWRRRAR